MFLIGSRRHFMRKKYRADMTMRLDLADKITLAQI
jgi:hypothetical protein